MTIAEKVKQMLDKNADNFGLAGALADAERLSDEFHEIKPIPYAVPIERYYGMPVQTHFTRIP